MTMVTMKGLTRWAACWLPCMMVMCITPTAWANDEPVKKGENTEAFVKGKELVVTEKTVDVKYFRDLSRRSKWRHNAAKDRLNGGSYSWDIYLPSSNKSELPGICVYVSPAGGGFTAVGRWKGMMDKANLIYIASRDSANTVPTKHRIVLTHRAVDILKERYKVDPSRIYVCGDSGGGRISSMVAPLYPDIFKGAIYSIGCNLWSNLRAVGGGVWRGYLLQNPPRMAEVRKNRFVFMTGDTDGNMKQTKANYDAYLKFGIRNSAYIQVKGMGHSPPPLDYWQVAFNYLDGNNLSSASKGYEAPMRASLAIDSGKRFNATDR